MTVAATAWKERLAALGTVGLVVHFSIFGLCIAAMAAGIRYGLLELVPWLAERLPNGATTFVGAYALTKVLTIPRLALTCAVTPLVARLLGRSAPAEPAGAAAAAVAEEG